MRRDPLRYAFVVFLGVLCGWAALSIRSTVLALAIGAAVPTVVWLLHRPQQWLLLFWGLLAVVPAMEIVSYGATIAFSDFLLLIGFGLMLVIKPNMPSGERAVFPVLLILVSVVQILSLLASGASAETILPSLLRVARSFGSILVLLHVAKWPWSHEDLRKLFRTLLVFATLSNLLTVLQFTFQWEFFARSHQYAWYGGQRFMRASGIFGEANHAGAFAALAALMALGYLEDKVESVKVRFMALSGLILALLALALTASRGAIVNLIAGMLILVMRLRGSSRLILMVSCAVVLVLANIPESGFVGYLLDRFSSTMAGLQTSPDIVLGGRLTFWSTLLEVVQDNPMFGVGYRLLPVVTADAGITTSDNNLMMALVETGVLGFAVTVGLLFWLLTRALHLLRQPRPTAVAVAAATIGFILQGFTVDSLTYWRLTPILFGLIELETLLWHNGKEEARRTKCQISS